MPISDEARLSITVTVVITAACLIYVGLSAMEASTFRKLTGRTDVTWWDAVWVELRVDDD